VKTHSFSISVFQHFVRDADHAGRKPIVTGSLLSRSSWRDHPQWTAAQANTGRAWSAGELATPDQAKRFICIVIHFVKKDFSSGKMVA
jgi:hypothetical protein